MNSDALITADGTLSILSKILMDAGWQGFDGAFDVYGPMPDWVPTAPGVYTILIAKGDPLRYPMSTTRVMYIGEAHGSEGLRGRLAGHQHYAAQCRAETEGRIYYPRYEWVNAAGGVCLYSAAPEYSDHSSRGMETRLIEEFRSIHYSLPLGNGQRGRQDRPEGDVTAVQPAAN